MIGSTVLEVLEACQAKKLEIVHRQSFLCTSEHCAGECVMGVSRQSVKVTKASI